MNLKNAISCLYCLIPLLGAAYVFMASKMARSRTYFDVLPEGIDPNTDAGKDAMEKCWNTSDERMRAVRKIYLSALAGVVVLELGLFFFTRFQINSVQAAPVATETPSVTVTLAETLTPDLSQTSQYATLYMLTATEKPSSTPTAKVVYNNVAQTVVVYQDRVLPVVITQLVVITATPGYTQTPWIVTATFTETPSPTTSETSSSTP